jgi:hypothetical protein
MNRPVTEANSAAAAIRHRLMLESDPRTLGRPACSAMVAEAGQLSEDVDARSRAKEASPDPSGTVGPDLAPGSLSGGKVSPVLIGSYRLMTELLVLR